MDSTAWAAVAAIAAIVAVVVAVGALLATALQLQQGPRDRETDYYRKLTPFLSFEIPTDLPSGDLSVDIYADGGGYAFNVIVNIDQANSSTGQNTQLPGQNVLRYLREGPPKRVGFATRVSQPFGGYLTMRFKDLFGIWHTARQSVNAATGQLATTDAIQWTCDTDCRVHVLKPLPPPGLLTRLAQKLRLY